MRKRKTSLVLAALAFVAIGLASGYATPDDPAPTGSGMSPARIFLEPLAQPTGAGNCRIQAGAITRTLSLDLNRLSADQKRYAETLDDANHLVILQGRQKTRYRVQDRSKVLAVKRMPGQKEELPRFVGQKELDPHEEELLIKNCLMITDLHVVEDPKRTTGTGPWTFGALMTNLANRSMTGIEPAKFVRRWLEIWENDQTINSFTVPNRKEGIKKLITDPWQKASGGEGKPLDLTKAPFRLLAIVNRLDLRSNAVLGAQRIGGGGAGEGRFVFCAYDIEDPAQKPLFFTVIFEFQIKRQNFHDVRAWADQWYALKTLPRGTPDYNQALQKITDQFVAPGTDPDVPPNQSALGQLRTNEIAFHRQMARDLGLVAPRWELREFRIDANNGGYLRQVTAKQTPARAFNDDPRVAQYVNGVQKDILAQEHHVPPEFAGQSFLGGAAVTPENTIWNAREIDDPEARHLFSLNTCSGCHAGETFPTVSGEDDNLTRDLAPPHFTHVRPRISGKEAQLSAFLTGKDKNGNPYVLDDPTRQRDPKAPGGIKRRAFHDLSNRAHDLAGLVEYGAIYEKDRRPLQMVH